MSPAEFRLTSPLLCAIAARCPLSVNTTDTTSLTVAPGDQKITFQNTGANVVVATATNFNGQSSHITITFVAHQTVIALQPRTTRYFIPAPTPRNARPGFAPVCTPSLNTSTPFTNTSRIPTDS